MLRNSPRQVPFRKRLRVFTEDRRVEGTIMFIVLTYFLVITLDLSVVEYVSFSQSSLYQTVTLDYGGASNEVLRFKAVGLSLVMHPHNPMAPTVHCNYRYFERGDGSEGEGRSRWYPGEMVSSRDGIWAR